MKTLTEYRIGNFVAEPEDKPGYFPIEEIKNNSQGKLSVYYRNGSINTTDPTPIELTEDWLKRLGFEKFGRNDLPRTLSYKKDWISIFPANSFSDFKGYGFMYYKKEFAGSVESARVAIEYVHQLQNLVHSLTGSELEIK